MSGDDRKGPVWRPRSHQDRDVYTDKRTPPSGVPDFVEEECTGRYEGDELKAARSKRPTDKRVEKLEEKHDKLDEKVDAIATSVSKMEGKLDTALAFITDQGNTTRTRITTNGKVLIALIGAAITTVGTVLVAWLS